MKIDIDIDLLSACRELLRLQNRDKPHYKPPTRKADLAFFINELLYQKLRTEAQLYENMYYIRSESLNMWLDAYRKAKR